VFQALLLKKLKIDEEEFVITKSEYAEQTNLIKSKIKGYIAEINGLQRTIENLYIVKTKEQLYDLFEMITSDLKDLKNHVDNLKSKYNTTYNYFN